MSLRRTALALAAAAAALGPAARAAEPSPLPLQLAVRDGRVVATVDLAPAFPPATKIRLFAALKA